MGRGGGKEEAPLSPYLRQLKVQEPVASLCITDDSSRALVSHMLQTVCENSALKSKPTPESRARICRYFLGNELADRLGLPYPGVTSGLVLSGLCFGFKWMAWGCKVPCIDRRVTSSFRRLSVEVQRRFRPKFPGMRFGGFSECPHAPAAYAPGLS